MVKILQKNKKGANEEVFAGGRIVVTPFSKLNKKDFPQYEDGDMIFLHYDGKIYINQSDPANEAIVILLKNLVQYPKKVLKQWEKEQKKRYPDIKKIEDLAVLKGNNEEFMKALSGFLVPLEIKSREMQKEYYGIL